MNPIKIKEGIYWVGGIDWDLRNFHGYLTQRGSTYNAYLIIDDHITLIDTVKHYKYDEMISRISKIIDPKKIEYLISNHVEMDHSGSLPKIKELVPNAKIYTSPNGAKGLKKHYKKDWDFNIVKSGDSLSLGKRSINFVLTPMVHWPDNMVSYMPEEKILFSNDAFGQHIASSERIDKDYAYNILMEEAKKYYANIVLPYGTQVQKALQQASELEIETICPSHGLIWQDNIAELMENYKKWSSNETDEKAIIIYDTMWKSTEKIAYAIADTLEEKQISYEIQNLQDNHISDIMTRLADAKYIFVGSPTLNSNMLPTVASFLTYMKGLAPKKRFGLAFGSYGWAPLGVNNVNKVLEEAGFEILGNPIKQQYIPSEDDLNSIRENIKNILK